jgi:hypothetical protein
MTPLFTIYVMQLAHTDIGYTHPQEQVGSMYLEHYDRMLDLCRHTADAPECERFKWTCETSWQVRNYLTRCPQRAEEFLYYARRGQIELTAGYLHFTDLIDVDAYDRSITWVQDYCHQHALPLHCAMHCDINGWPWAVADILAAHGILFFCSQMHLKCGTDPLGRRGSIHYHWTRKGGLPIRPDAPIHIPQAFWWQGPRGGRVLHWLGEHYLLGNILGISSPHPFAIDIPLTRRFERSDRATVDDLYAIAQREVPQYVARLRNDGYPYDALLVSSSGYLANNSPPDNRWCEVIARWNTEHDEIHLRTATLGEWFNRLLTYDQSAWPMHQVAWPDRWAHGLGAATARIAQARRTQRRRPHAIALVEIAKSIKAQTYLNAAFEQEYLALEHSFGARFPSARPGSPLNDFEQATKEITFHRADLYLDDAINTALEKITVPCSTPHLYVYNYNVVPTADFHVVHFESSDQHLNPEYQFLISADGMSYAFQRDGQSSTHFVAALPLNQVGLNGFELSTSAGRNIRAALQPASFRGAAEETQHGSTPAPSRPNKSQISSQVELETSAWLLRIDPASGGLVSLYSRREDREWVDTQHQYTFGQLIHEVVEHSLGREAVGTLAWLVALGVADDKSCQQFANAHDRVVTHETLMLEGLPRYVEGPVFRALELRGEGKRIGQVHLTWRLYHTLPIVELLLDWYKYWSELPEAAYVAFPFAAAGGELLLETAGGFFRPGSHKIGGQLPGTCSTYYTVKRAARATMRGGASLYWLPIDAPLVMPNRICFPSWDTEEWSWNGFLASMPVNHYWSTNFPMGQRGYLKLRYRMISPYGLPDDEETIQAALPLEALGWR